MQLFMIKARQCRAFIVFGIQDARRPGCQGARIPGYRGAEMPGYQDAGK